MLYGVDSAGAYPQAIAVCSRINFDGNRNYTINAMASDSSSGSVPTAFSTPELYTISASGFGFIANPIADDNIFGLVSANGVFISNSLKLPRRL